MAGRGRASASDMNRVETAILLRVLRDESHGDGKSHLSGPEMAQCVGVSEYRSRAAVSRLIANGDLESKPAYREDGGQGANSLVVTDAGKARLKELFSD